LDLESEGPTEANYQQADFWIEKFRELSRTRDIIGMHILAKIYLKPGTPYVLGAMAKDLRLITRNKSTVYKKCQKLSVMGLIEMSHSYPCLIYPVKGIPEQSMKQLIAAIDARMGVNYG
jgi:hypothetical protein